MLGSRAYCIGGGSAVSILQMQGSANNGLSRQKADTHQRQLRVMNRDSGALGTAFPILSRTDDWYFIKGLHIEQIAVYTDE